MTRRFLDDVRADLNAVLVTGGETTALELKELLIDTIDSTIQDEAAIVAPVPLNSFATTTTFGKIPLVEVRGGDGIFLKPDGTLSQIVTATTPGFTYALGAQVAFIAGNNDSFEFSITEQGIPTGFIATAKGNSNGDTLTVYVREFIGDAVTDAVYALEVRSIGSASSIDITSAYLGAVIQPTNNP